MIEDWIDRDIRTIRGTSSNPEDVATYVAIRLEDPMSFLDEEIFKLLTDEEQVALDVLLEKREGWVNQKNFGSLSRGKWNPEDIDETLEEMSKHDALVAEDLAIWSKFELYDDTDWWD